MSATRGRREHEPDVPVWAHSMRPYYTADQLGEPPTGTVWIEWTGEPSPYENPTIMYKAVLGQIDAGTREVLDAMDQMRIVRIEGITYRTLRQGNGLGEIPHMTEPVYVWGPNHKAAPGQIGSFVQALSNADADRVKSSNVGHEFRVWCERDGGAVMPFLIPDGNITLGKEETFQSVKTFSRAMGWR